MSAGTATHTWKHRVESTPRIPNSRAAFVRRPRRQLRGVRGIPQPRMAPAQLFQERMRTYPASTQLNENCCPSERRATPPHGSSFIHVENGTLWLRPLRANGHYSVQPHRSGRCAGIRRSGPQCASPLEPRQQSLRSGNLRARPLRIAGSRRAIILRLRR